MSNRSPIACLLLTLLLAGCISEPSSIVIPDDENAGSADAVVSLAEPEFNENQQIGISPDCVSQNLTAEEMRVIESSMGDKNIAAHQSASAPTVDVYIHKIRRTSSQSSMSYNQATGLYLQVKTKFDDAGLNFRFRGVTNTVNRTWYDNAGFRRSGNEVDNSYAKQMKSALHKGNKRTLNIYVLGPKNSGGIKNYSNFPWVNLPLSRDGVVLSSDENSRFLNHEVGHWMGLYHIFEGGCQLGHGDYVPDTPRQAVDYSGQCGGNFDTCAGEGPDLVNNLMGFADCRSTLTRGQESRISWMYYWHRINSAF